MEKPQSHFTPGFNIDIMNKTFKHEWFFGSVCLCLCVSERKERERESANKKVSVSKGFRLILLCFSGSKLLFNR